MSEKTDESKVAADAGTEQDLAEALKGKDWKTGDPYEAVFTSNFDSGNLNYVAFDSTKNNHVSTF